MLFNELDKLKRSAIMSSIILMFVGALLLILPITILDLFNNLLGFACLVTFVVILLIFISSKKALINFIKLFIGLLFGILGFILLVFDYFLITTLGLLVGLIPIISGVYGIVHAILFARVSGRKGWWLLIILSVLLIGFGVFQFWNPWMTSSEGMIKVIGGTLMATSVISALRLIWIWPIQNNKIQEAK